MNVLDLFSGVGGFSLGLERAGMETVAFCEIVPFCRKVLRKHWPNVPIHEDITKLTTSDITEPIDLVCGGFPCQPFSTASAGKRVQESMWPEMFRVIEEVRPQYVIVENVEELPIRWACSNLADRGWRTVQKRIGGYHCGAPHYRDRWWGIAHPHKNGEFHRRINAETQKLPALCKDVWGRANFAEALRIPDGLSDRLDRVRSLGNAVIPQIPEAFGRAIMESVSEQAGTKTFRRCHDR